MLAPHDYDRYRILSGGMERPDFSVAWAEVDGQRVQLITAPPVPANARLTVLRRLAEREALAVDSAAHYLAGGVDERRTWLALAASDGPALHELAGWVADRRELGSPDLASRVIADLAASLREVVKRAPSLPASGIGDVRVAADGRLELGQLGEVLTSPRLDERELVVELGGWLTRLCGRVPDPVEDIAEKAMNGSIRYLVDLAEDLERRMDELGPPPRSRVGGWARHMVDEHPPIAPPTLVDEYTGDTPLQNYAAGARSEVRAIRTDVHHEQARPAPVRMVDTPPPAPMSGGEFASGAPMVGMVLGGQYRIVGRIANGMMGRIYEATRTSDYRRVAVKLLLPRDEDDFDTMAQRNARFRREAESLAKLDHPNIVKVYDYGVQPEVWLAMEFVDGPTLAKVLKTRPYLEVDEVLVIARKLCSALAHAHEQGVVHRDLKPANVILEGGDPAEVRLVDFGLAKDFDGTDNLTNEGTLLGTPHYMSPEQCNGEPQRVESDLYALGMLMFRLLTGRMPFEGKKGVGILLAHTRDPVPRFESLRLTFSIPPEIEYVVRKCLEKKPEHRYRSAADLDAALASCQDPTAKTAFAVLARPRMAIPGYIVPLMGAVVFLLMLGGLATTAGVMWILHEGTSPSVPAEAMVAPATPAAPTLGATLQAEPLPLETPTPKPKAAPVVEAAPIEPPAPRPRPAPAPAPAPEPSVQPAPAPAPVAKPAPAPLIHNDNVDIFAPK